MTFSSWVAGVAAMDVAGVKRQFAAPPAQLNAGDLPAMYPREPSGGNTVASFGGSMGLTTVATEIVIAVCPVQLSLPAAEFARVLSMVDALLAAAESNAQALGIDGLTVRSEMIVAGGDTVYWALVATVEGSF